MLQPGCDAPWASSSGGSGGSGGGSSVITTHPCARPTTAPCFPYAGHRPRDVQSGQAAGGSAGRGRRRRCARLLVAAAAQLIAAAARGAASTMRCSTSLSPLLWPMHTLLPCLPRPHPCLKTRSGRGRVPRGAGGAVPPAGPRGLRGVPPPVLRRARPGARRGVGVPGRLGLRGRVPCCRLVGGPCAALMPLASAATGPVCSG